MINLEKVRTQWVDEEGPAGVVVASLCNEVESLRREAEALQDRLGLALSACDRFQRARGGAPIELTDGIRRAYALAWFRGLGLDDDDAVRLAEREVKDPTPWRDAALRAVLALVERQSAPAGGTP